MLPNLMSSTQESPRVGEEVLQALVSCGVPKYLVNAVTLYSPHWEIVKGIYVYADESNKNEEELRKMLLEAKAERDELKRRLNSRNDVPRHEFDQVNSRLAQAVESNTTYANDLAARNEELEGLKKQLAELQSNQMSSSSDIKAKLAASQLKVQELATSQVKLEVESAKLKSQIVELNDKLKSSNEKVEDGQKRIQELLSKLGASQDEIKKLRRQYNELGNKYKKSLSSSNDDSTKLEEDRNKLQELSAKLAATQTKLTEATNDVSRLSLRESFGLNKTAELERGNLIYSKKIQELEAKVGELEQTISLNKDTIEKFSNTINACEETKSALGFQNELLERRRNEAVEKAHKLESDYSVLQRECKIAKTARTEMLEKVARIEGELKAAKHDCSLKDSQISCLVKSKTDLESKVTKAESDARMFHTKYDKEKRAHSDYHSRSDMYKEHLKRKIDDLQRQIALLKKILVDNGIQIPEGSHQTSPVVDVSTPIAHTDSPKEVSPSSAKRVRFEENLPTLHPSSSSTVCVNIEQTELLSLKDLLKSLASELTSKDNEVTEMKSQIKKCQLSIQELTRKNEELTNKHRNIDRLTSQLLISSESAEFNVPFTQLIYNIRYYL